MDVAQIAVSYPTYGDEASKMNPTGLDGINGLSWPRPFTTCEGLAAAADLVDPGDIDKLLCRCNDVLCCPDCSGVVTAPS